VLDLLGYGHDDAGVRGPHRSRHALGEDDAGEGVAEVLPGPLRAATYLDPVFYAVDAFRFAAVGVSDAPPYPALAALVVFAALAFLGTVDLIPCGYKLRY
jgi:hypothetical protein